MTTTDQPTIIVVGCTPRLGQALYKLPLNVKLIEVEDAFDANDLVTGEYPHAVVAYGPQTFPLFATGRPQYVAAARDHAMLFTNDPGTASAGAGVFEAMDNPEAFVWTAFGVVTTINRAVKLYDVSVPEALSALAILAGA
jgi:hypothetical protein